MRHVLLLFLGLWLASASQACPRAVARDAATPSAPVYLNQADAETLRQGLTGIGEAKARAIVAWRAQHGAFRSIDELAEVKGIGPALLARNRARIRL